MEHGITLKDILAKGRKGIRRINPRGRERDLQDGGEPGLILLPLKKERYTETESAFILP
jgi:hypothetical protein